jgi:hypothetical protein
MGSNSFLLNIWEFQKISKKKMNTPRIIAMIIFIIKYFLLQTLSSYYSKVKK